MALTWPTCRPCYSFAPCSLRFRLCTSRFLLIAICSLSCLFHVVDSASGFSLVCWPFALLLLLTQCCLRFALLCLGPSGFCMFRFYSSECSHAWFSVSAFQFPSKHSWTAVVNEQVVMLSCDQARRPMRAATTRRPADQSALLLAEDFRSQIQ